MFVVWSYGLRRDPRGDGFEVEAEAKIIGGRSGIAVLLSTGVSQEVVC